MTNIIFHDGPIQGVIIKAVACHRDERGWLVELFRQDELDDSYHPQMAYVSETCAGVVRGPHAHVHQTDYFAFVGPGDFELALWDAREDSPTHGHRQKLIVGESNRGLVIIPPGVVHAYKNISRYPGWVFNCPNQLYAGPGRKSEVDEIRYEDRDNHPFTWD